MVNAKKKRKIKNLTILALSSVLMTPYHIPMPHRNIKQTQAYPSTNPLAKSYLPPFLPLKPNMEAIEKLYQEVLAKREAEKPKVQAYVEYIMEVTAYTIAEGGKAFGSPGYGVTASGKKVGTSIQVSDGVIAAPREFPFGTVMEVTGWGIGTVWDRGGAIGFVTRLGIYRIDVLMATKKEAYAWGRRRVVVRVYTKKGTGQ